MQWRAVAGIKHVDGRAAAKGQGAGRVIAWCVCVFAHVRGYVGLASVGWMGGRLSRSSVTISGGPQRAARCSGTPNAALATLASAPARTNTLAHSSRCSSAALAACVRDGTLDEGVAAASGL